MAAVTIKSNETVLNEVKDNYALLESPYRKEQWTFWPNQYYIVGCYCISVYLFSIHTQ